MGHLDRTAGDFIELRVKVSREQVEARRDPESDPIAHARQLLRDMRRRAEFFPDLKAAEPAWAMMLDLLVQESRGRGVCVQSACLASGAPMTTALRRLTKLIDAGEIVRTADPADRRRWFVSLSLPAKRRLLCYLSQISG